MKGSRRCAPNNPGRISGLSGRLPPERAVAFSGLRNKYKA